MTRTNTLGLGLIIGLCATLGGCASLREASAGQVGCRPSDIEISDDSVGWSTRTWTATCNGRSHSCAYVATGGGDGSTSGQVNCSPMGGSAGPAAASHPQGGRATSGGSNPAPKAVGAKAERSFDEQRRVHLVRGRFKVASGIELRLIGIPQMAFGTIAVVVTGYSRDHILKECRESQVLVNGEPHSATQHTRRTEGNTVNIEGRFGFALFQPLAQQYSTFGVRACGHKWEVTEAQLPTLQKFLVIYSQISQQVQRGELEDRSTTPPAPEPSSAATEPTP